LSTSLSAVIHSIKISLLARISFFFTKAAASSEQDSKQDSINITPAEGKRNKNKNNKNTNE